MNIQIATNELHKAFGLFNESLFSNELPLPALLIHSYLSEYKSSFVLGWCTRGKVWLDEFGNDSMYEIVITAERLNRPYEKVLETLLHEMVHLWCKIKGIKDVDDKPPQFHNLHFKDAAEAHGLMVFYDKKYGYAITGLKNSTERLIESWEDRNLDAFKLSRWRPDPPPKSPKGKGKGEDEDEGEGSNQKKQRYRYECDCRKVIESDEPVNAHCMDCDVPFELL